MRVHRRRSGLLPLLTAVAAAASALLPSHAAAIPAVDSAQIRAFVREMVSKYAFNAHRLTTLLEAARLQPDILKAISNPAEARPWYAYRPIFVTEARTDEGVAFWNENRDTLNRAMRTYGVAPGIIVAIIGVESRYGRHKGGYRVLDALTTLSFNYPPRGAFFRRQLEQFLLLAREEHFDPTRPMGSYAGAMGRPQFISSSYRQYAVDFDGDGFRDLWSDDADTIGSVANYFARHGWERGAPVAARVQVTGTAFRALLSDSPEPTQTVGALRAAGVQIPAQLPDTLPAALFSLQTRDGPEYWIGLHNFYVITRYNHSILYAMAAYQLSQAITARLDQTHTAARLGAQQ